MPKIYFCGLTSSSLVRPHKSDKSITLSAIKELSRIQYENATNIEIGWDYFLIWENKKIYVSKKNFSNNEEGIFSLEIPKQPEITFKQAIPGSEHITLLTDSHDLWIYKIGSDTWKKVPDFIPKENDNDKKEYAIKVAQGRCTVALTNLGRAYSIPIMLNNQDAMGFVDVICGFDHIILLAKNGDVYSTGMGTRGQLGHGDLEDCDEPKLIEALAGLRVVQIAASGWHSAVITDQGDMYTWGWNNHGQLGLPDVENVVAIPTLVNFNNDNGDTVEINISKVQCGNAFTICRTDTGEFWGSGSNKYGQLCLSNNESASTRKFVEIKFNSIKESIKDFKCREWGTCIFV